MAHQISIDKNALEKNSYLYANVWGCKWVGEINYAFGAGLSPLIDNFGISSSENSITWSDFERVAVKQVLQSYGNVCNINFIENVFNSDNLPNLVIYKVTQDVLGTNSGIFEVPDASKPTLNTNYGLFNISTPGGFAPFWANFDVGGGGYELLLHEFGHAVGLAHPHDGGGSQYSAPYPGINRHGASVLNMGSNNLNQGIWSTMSYNGGWEKTAYDEDTGLVPALDRSFGYQATPMAFDIAALQALYGANMSFNSNDDVYPLVSKNAVGTNWTCIWDAGGIDEISNADSILECIIDLREALLTNNPNGGGFVSHNQNIAGGYTIAKGAIIENATGGLSNDQLIGNVQVNLLSGDSGNDSLTGNGGNDFLDGGAGLDTAKYSGLRCDYILDDGAFHVTDSIAARDGIDTLQSIERLQFTDVVIGLDVGLGENTGEVYRLYHSLLGREPDSVGCGYWINMLDKEMLSTEQLVDAFLNSNEFNVRFGSIIKSTEALVNLLYSNISGNQGSDNSDFALWLNNLDIQSASKDKIVISFIESPENVASLATMIGSAPVFEQWMD